MMQQVSYDVAWHLFDEVNQGNDIEVLVDLACLSVLDAEAIVKQKLYDLGRTCRANGQEAKYDEYVLVVACADEHL